MAAEIETLSGPALAAVRESELFSGMDPAEVAKLLAVGERVEIGDREILLREGETGDSFFIVLEGSVDVLVTRDEVQERVHTLGTGSVLGEISLLCKRPRTATVQAAGGSVVAHRFDSDAFQAMQETCPETGDRISRIAVLRAQETMRRLYS